MTPFSLFEDWLTHRKSEYSSLTNLSTKLLFPTADSPRDKYGPKLDDLAQLGGTGTIRNEAHRAGRA